MDLLERHQRQQIQNFQKILKRVLAMTEAFDFESFEASRKELEADMDELTRVWADVYSQLIETEDDE